MSASNHSSILSKDDIKQITSWAKKIKKIDHLSKKQRINKAKNELKLKYKVIGAGRNRIVFDVNNRYALKVVITEKGLKNNEIEFKIYKHCPDHLRKHLCPVKEIGFGWIIMDKMKKKVPRNKLYKRKKQKLKKKFQKNGIVPKDVKWANTALSKSGDITVLDYGIFSIPSKGIKIKKRRKK
ncbi:hypothetical protein [Scopulibacillus cellulosilyticus]|uniref:Uncharacterized protein n=1 Tax=Scopulibacillus cellulosilyticus TaxID=2665665 RepID=A0ABW2PYJ3_9BACL